MTSRTATSIVLLAVLLTGMATPAGACALMCLRRHRADSQRHCGRHSEVMPAMDHDHSAMNHPDVEAVSPALFRQSCQANCVAVERLAVSWKVVLQVTPVQSGIVALDTAANFLPPDLPWSRRLDGTPPELFSPYAAYFSILRI